MMKKLSLLYVICTLAVSCMYGSKESLRSDDTRSETYSVRVEVDLPHSAADTRSTFTEEQLNRISDLNVFVYHDGVLLEDHCGYFTDVSSVMLSFPCDKDGFNIYMVGNVGAVDPPYRESDIYDIQYVIGSYDEFRTKGFPIANIFEDYEKGTLAVFRLKRLIGQYNISMRTSAADAQYQVKDVRLLNCAMDMYPFSKNKKASVFADDTIYGQHPSGDSLTEEDIAALNNGQSVSLYFVENLQGELLPENTDRKKKIPSSLDELENGLADKCTYIEITADIITQGARYTDGRYRFYLGQNEFSDFSICRNTLYDVTLDFTQNMVNEEEWRIEVDEPEVMSIRLSKETAHVIKGVNDCILIQGPRVVIDTDLSDEINSEDFMCTLSDAEVDGVSCQKLTFSSYRDIIGKYDWHSDYSGLSSRYTVALKTEETYNGEPLERKTIEAYAHNRLFPLLIRMGTNSYSAPYQLEVLTDAPIDLDISISAVLKADVGNSGTVNTYTASTSAKGLTTDGYNCNYARFASLYNSGLSKNVYFKLLNVNLIGRNDENNSTTRLYMPEEGKIVYGPGYAPESYSGNISGSNTFSFTQYASDGSLIYRVYDSDAGGSLFNLNYNGTGGFQHRVSFDWDEINADSYLPFYICNGGHEYFAPHTVYNESAPYVNGSGRVGVLAKSYVPGRDVFYPNGARWGSTSEQSPDNEGNYGYIGEHKIQVFGEKNWTTYCAYDCDFFMTVNDCTAWPGASGLQTGFLLEK